MSDSLFQVTGISSGISWDEIISKTLAAAQKPAEQWQSKIDTLEYKKSLYEEFSSSLFKLRNSLTTLRIPSMFKSKTAEFNVRNAGQTIPQGLSNTFKASNAADIVKATVTADAEIAQWKIDVTQIAQKQQVYSDRQSDLTMPLGLTGTFKIRVGAQVTEIKVTASDTLRTINQSIALAKDQNGDRIDVTAQLIDNRLVIESASSGTGNTGEKGSETLAYSLSDGNTTFLPKAATGTTYPPSILSLTVKGVPYVEGSANDFTYDSSTGKITWMTGHVPTEDGAVIEVEYASS
ncbi:MAG: flagellar hook protein, partial [Synergistaceae bacterium]|nr:flagellar hook protein [Synergistaceae bacterium]